MCPKQGRGNVAVCPKVLTSIKELQSKFDVDPDAEWLSTTTILVKKAMATYSSGLLFEAYRSAANKGELRSKVVKVANRLDAYSMTSKDLPKPMATFVDNAMSFGVALM